jgi:hypothetical protein
VFWDSDVAKVVEGMCYDLVLHPEDKALADELDKLVALIVSAQQPDGYLNTHFTVVAPEDRWKHLAWAHELYNRGGGFGMTGNGLIENCIADHNSTIYSTTDSYGGGIAAANGKVVTCLVYANTSVCGAGIAALGSAAFYNCTVVTNIASGSYDGTVGGVYSSSTSAKIYNMIFADNVALTTKSYTGKPCWYGVTTGQVTACAFPVGIAVPSSAEGACYTLDPLFRNKAADDWRLSPDSPAINKGVWNQAWGLTGTDLLGNARLKAKKVDLGCYECQTGGLTFIVR